MLPQAIADYVIAQDWGSVTAAQPVGGGCINDGQVLTTARGPRLFLKLNSTAPADMFIREAEGLTALATAPGGPRVPAAMLAGADFLLLEFLPSAPHAAHYAATLGQRLAALHHLARPAFGFDHDNYIGSTPQPNPWTEAGCDFFGEHRLAYQARLARQRGLLSGATLRRVERIAQRLAELVPTQPASLLHGDLWTGNILPGPDGHACLIDPAAHFGWAEAELAMTTLFGRLPEEFYAAYAAARPLAPGYRDRFPLYNLYHLLNHLNLFGGGYLSAVEDIVDRYA